AARGNLARIQPREPPRYWLNFRAMIAPRSAAGFHSMGFISWFAHPLLLALLALVAGFFVAAWALGAFRTEREEARAGVALLCAMRWNEFCRLITEMLKDRGMQPANAERAPGQDGFDLLFTRGNSRYLVLCQKGAAQRISAAAVGQLH